MSPLVTGVVVFGGGYWIWAALYYIWLRTSRKLDHCAAYAMTNDKFMNYENSKEKKEIQYSQNEYLGDAYAIMLGLNDSDGIKWHILDLGDTVKYGVDPKSKKFVRQSGSSAILTVYETREEYKFEGIELQSRTVEKFMVYGGEVSSKIKDGVILESQIRKDCIYLDFTKEMAQLQKEIEWGYIIDHRLRFFIMSCHPEIFPISELRKIARSKLEKMKSGRMQLEKAAEDHGFKLQPMDGYHAILAPDNLDKTMVIPTFEGLLLQCEVTSNEFEKYPEFVLWISSFLDGPNKCSKL